jgi:chromosome partitioning protein
MAVIAIYSVKGGVGKTTLAVDLAWRLATHGQHTTLLWDLDLQGGAGYLLGRDPPHARRAASVFQREGKPRQLITLTDYQRLSLIEADESLRQLPIQLARLGQRKRLAQMTAFLKAEYSRIVLDCPAGLNEIAEQALTAADVVIVPLPPSPLSARALDMVRRELARLHQRHPPILPVLSMYDARRKLHREVAADVAQGWPVIPMSSPIEQAAVRRAPLGTFAGSSDAGQAMERLFHGIEARIAKGPGG